MYGIKHQECFEGIDEKAPIIEPFEVHVKVFSGFFGLLIRQSVWKKKTLCKVMIYLFYTSKQAGKAMMWSPFMLVLRKKGSWGKLYWDSIGA